MIWFSLILFAVSFIATVLLAPKPEFEDARPEDLDPNNFPQATEDAPVPLVLGCVRLSGPNTLWYGDFRSDPITEKHKTGLFSSTTVTVGFRYYLSLDLGICLGPSVFLKQIIMDDVEVASGDTLYFEEFQEHLVALDTPFYTVLSGNNWAEVSLLGALQLTAEEYDILAGQGNIAVGYSANWSTDVSPIFGGPGPAQPVMPDGYRIQFGWNEFSGDPPLPNMIIPIEGEAALKDFTVDAANPVNLLIANTAPVGARYLNRQNSIIDTTTVFTTVSGWGSVFSISMKGTIATAVNFDINEPELYGGRLSGGGHIGNFTFYPGNFDQVVDPAIEAMFLCI